MADVRKLIDALRVPMANQTNPYTKNGIPNVDLAETGQFVNSFMPISGDIQSGIQTVSDVKNKKYADALLNSVGLLPFVPALGGVVKEISPKFDKWMELTKKAENDISRSNLVGTHKDYNLYHEDLSDAGEPFGQIRAYDKNGNAAGTVFYGKRNEIKDKNAYEGSVEVNPSDRRKGLATAMYNKIEEITGGKMIPAENHTNDAMAFWKSRNLTE